MKIATPYGCGLVAEQEERVPSRPVVAMCRRKKQPQSLLVRSGYIGPSQKKEEELHGALRERIFPTSSRTLSSIRTDEVNELGAVCELPLGLSLRLRQFTAERICPIWFHFCSIRMLHAEHEVLGPTFEQRVQILVSFWTSDVTALSRIWHLGFFSLSRPDATLE